MIGNNRRCQWSPPKEKKFPVGLILGGYSICVMNIQPVQSNPWRFFSISLQWFFIYIFYYNKISLHYNGWRENTLWTFLNSWEPNLENWRRKNYKKFDLKAKLRYNSNYYNYNAKYNMLELRRSSLQKYFACFCTCWHISIWATT